MFAFALSYLGIQRIKGFCSEVVRHCKVSDEVKPPIKLGPRQTLPQTANLGCILEHSRRCSRIKRCSTSYNYSRSGVAGKTAYFRSETILVAELAWKTRLFLVLIYYATNVREHAFPLL